MVIIVATYAKVDDCLRISWAIVLVIALFCSVMNDLGVAFVIGF